MIIKHLLTSSDVTIVVWLPATTVHLQLLALVDELPPCPAVFQSLFFMFYAQYLVTHK